MKGSARALFLLALLAAGAAAADAPVGWRNDGTGRFKDSGPTEWSSKYVAWKADLPGSSYSAPIVVGDKIFVASDPGDLVCVGRKDGKTVWRKDVADVKAPASAGGKGGKGGFPGGGKGGGGKGGGGMGGRSAGNTAATPVSDGKLVAAVFGNGVVAAFDLDGKRLWAKHVDSTRVGFGHAASPVLIDGKVIVHVNDLVALDLATGKEVWRTPLAASHASPVAAKAGKTAVVVSPTGAVVAAADGKKLADGGMRSSDNSPVVEGDVVCFAGRGAFKLVEKDGKVSTEKLWGGGAGGGGRGDRRLSSPIVHEGMLYGIGAGGFLEVADVKTGEQVYRKRLGLGEVYSSLAMAGGLIYAFDLAGKAVVFKPGKEFAQVGTSSLEGTGSCPVFADGKLFVRGKSALYCVGK